MWISPVYLCLTKKYLIPKFTQQNTLQEKTQSERIELMVQDNSFGQYRKLIHQKHKDIEEAKKIAKEKFSDALYLVNKIDLIEEKSTYEKKLVDEFEYDNEKSAFLIDSCMGTAAVARAAIGSLFENMKVSRDLDNIAITAVDNSLFSCDTCLANTHEIAATYATETPNKNEIINEIINLDVKSHEELYLVLKEKLIDYEIDFQEELQNSEKTLNSDLPNCGTLATHTMRDLFDNFIKRYAPKSVVKKQKWFLQNERAKGWVTRLAHIRYFIYGSNEEIDEYVLESLNLAAEEANISLNMGHKYAHVHDSNYKLDFYKNVIDKLRRTMIEIICLREKYFKI